MMRNFLALSALAAASLLAASPASAATVLDVGRSEGCGKTTCFNEKGVFTQTWSAKDASGPMNIGRLLLDRGVLGSLDGSTFRLSFTLDGKEVGSWGSFTMGGIGGDQLTFTGENFTWNPEDGDLMLVLEIMMPKAGVGGFSFTSAPDSDPARDFGQDSRGPGTQGGSEMEAFVPGPSDVSAAPEPSAWALMIAGCGMAGATLRRRRTRVVA